MKKVLLTATVQSHIAQFHKPLINMLKENGYEVHVAARDNLVEKNGLQLNEADEVFNIPFDRFPFSKNNIVAYKQLKQIIDNTVYDVIHCNTPMGGVITRLAAKKARKKGSKVFYTAHGFHFYKGAPKKNWMIYYPIEKWFARYTDKLITITKEDYELAKKKFKTEVVHIHGVGANSDRYYPYGDEEKSQLRKEFKLLDNEFIVLCIGELNNNKNQATIIKAIAEVNKVKPNIKLLLAGNGPLENELKELTKKLNIVNNVKFLGYRTDLDKWVNLSDIIVSASLREGLPLNIMEAMLCKKPIIASINRGHNELINDGFNGSLVSHNDVERFKNKIIYYLENSDHMRIISSNAYNDIKVYTERFVVDELRRTYEL